MTSNVGGIDRILRIAIGAVLVLLALTGVVGVWGWLQNHRETDTDRRLLIS